MNRSQYIFMLLICALISCNQKHYGFREKISVGSKTAITTTKQAEIKLVQRQMEKAISSVIVADIPALQPIKVIDKKVFFQKKLKSEKMKVLKSTYTNLSDSNKKTVQNNRWDGIKDVLVFMAFAIGILGIMFLLVLGILILFPTLFLFLAIVLGVVLFLLILFALMLIVGVH